MIENKGWEYGLRHLVVLGSKIILHDLCDRSLDFLRWKYLRTSQRVGVNFSTTSYDHLLARYKVERPS